MSNPTLINGFEDIVTFIKQQEHRNQQLKKENNELKQKSIIQDYIIKNMLYKFLCDGEDAEIEIDKKWGKGRDKSFNIQYSDVMKEVCKKMDEDDWNDNANRGGEYAVTLDWHNDTLEVVLDEE